MWRGFGSREFLLWWKPEKKCLEGDFEWYGWVLDFHPLRKTSGFHVKVYLCTLRPADLRPGVVFSGQAKGAKLGFWEGQDDQFRKLGSRWLESCGLKQHKVFKGSTIKIGTMNWTRGYFFCVQEWICCLVLRLSCRALNDLIFLIQAHTCSNWLSLTCSDCQEITGWEVLRLTKGNQWKRCPLCFWVQEIVYCEHVLPSSLTMPLRWGLCCRLYRRAWPESPDAQSSCDVNERHVFSGLVEEHRKRKEESSHNLHVFQ